MKMKGVAAAVLGLAALGAASSVAAQAAKPPGADSIAGAFFRCDGGANAFTVQYGGDKLARADITTAAGRVYHLKKADTPTGWLWKNGSVAFWTDGQTVTLKGAPLPYADCQRPT